MTSSQWSKAPWTRAAGVVTCFGLLSATASCDSLTGARDEVILVDYEADGLEVFQQTHDWSPLPITYLQADLVGVNVTSDSVVVSMPDCRLDLEAFSPTDTVPDAPALWRLRTKGSWPSEYPSLCFDGAGGTLGPGESLFLSTGAIPLAEILADSLSAGPYRFRVQLDGEITAGGSIQTETRQIDFGTVELPESQYPLPVGTYPRDGFFYRVELLPASGLDEDPMVRLTVTHGGHYSGTLIRELSLLCPVRLLGYSTEADRERIPLPIPTWIWPSRVRGCQDDAVPIRLEPGGVATFEYLVPRARFGGNGLTIEDYFVIAIVDVDQRPIRVAVDPS